MASTSIDNLFPEPGKIVERIRHWGIRQPSIIGIFLYGSFARRNYDNFSDIDMVIVHNNEADLGELVRGLRDCIQARFDLVKDGKHIFFIADPYRKVEITFTDSGGFIGMEKIFRGSRIAEPARSVVFDRTGVISERLRSWSVEPGKSPSLPEIEREAVSFMYYYEAFHAHFHRGDSYRAFFYYSLAYFKLATFTSTVHGNADFIYSPAKLFLNLPDDVTKRLKRVSPTMNIVDLGLKKEGMYDAFIQELARTDGRIKPDIQEALAFREFVHSSYPHLWRLRDIATGPDMKAGVLFRSTNFKYYPKEQLEEWMHKTGIKTVFDFRVDSEVERGGYSYLDFPAENYVRLPIETGKALSPTVKLEPNDLSPLYQSFLDNQDLKNALSAIFNAIAGNNSTPAVFHCWAGVDRTGVVAAVIQAFSGLSRPSIVGDYLMSGGHVRQEYIEAVLDDLESKGGVSSYLSGLGLDKGTLQSARNCMSARIDG